MLIECSLSLVGGLSKAFYCYCHIIRLWHWCPIKESSCPFRNGKLPRNIRSVDQATSVWQFSCGVSVLLCKGCVWRVHKVLFGLIGLHRMNSRDFACHQTYRLCHGVLVNKQTWVLRAHRAYYTIYFHFRLLEWPSLLSERYRGVFIVLSNETGHCSETSPLLMQSKLSGKLCMQLFKRGHMITAMHLNVCISLFCKVCFDVFFSAACFSSHPKFLIWSIQCLTLSKK